MKKRFILFVTIQITAGELHLKQDWILFQFR